MTDYEVVVLPKVTKDWILSRNTRKPPLERLMSNIAVSESGCWEIQSNLDRSGYGKFKIGGRQLGAHKISYILHKGDFDQENLEVMHSCDNPRCINPDHLSVGTHKENMLDCILKGRFRPRGKDSFCRRVNDVAPFMLNSGSILLFMSTREVSIIHGDKTYSGGNCKKHEFNSIRRTTNGECVFCRRDYNIRQASVYVEKCAFSAL